MTATTVDGGDQATAASVNQTLHVEVVPGSDAAVLHVAGETAADGLGPAGKALNSTSMPSIADFHHNQAIEFSSLLDATFGPGGFSPTADNGAPVNEAGPAMPSGNFSGAGGILVSAAYGAGIHAGNVVTAVLEHAQLTAQLTGHA